MDGPKPSMVSVSELRTSHGNYPAHRFLPGPRTDGLCLGDTRLVAVEDGILTDNIGTPEADVWIYAELSYREGRTRHVQIITDTRIYLRVELYSGPTYARRMVTSINHARTRIVSTDTIPLTTTDRGYVIREIRRRGLGVDDGHIQYITAAIIRSMEDKRQSGVTKPGWYFWDETDTYAYGPYSSSEEAYKQLCEYAKTI